MNENICAVATPYGMGAIAVIRCSGPNAIELVQQVFQGADLTKKASHTLQHGQIVYQNEIIDEVLCGIFRAPTSFDGENMVEINCHGGILVTEKVLEVLLDIGFRLAERGEFSKRAFLNGKLDLTQAEAIMDLVSAKNEFALKSAEASLRKKTTQLIHRLRERLLDVLAKIEVNIDYPEYEDSVTVTREWILPILNETTEEKEKILETSAISTMAIHGIQTIIVGKPNVGKSSLLNTLLEEDKAIVSSVAGTTRDLVDGTLTIGNLTLHLLDTAGIHQSEDEVEKIGIERTQKKLEQAQLVLLVLDLSRPLDEEDRFLWNLTEKKPRILVANKADLPHQWKIEGQIEISTVSGSGIDELLRRIKEMTKIEQIDVYQEDFLTNERQTRWMKEAHQALKNAKESCMNGVEVDLIEIDLKEAFDALGQITGEATPEELLTALFSKFCLGK